MSGGHLNEKQWMDQRPEIRDRAKVAIVCEHFGAIEWKDSMKDGKPVYEATGEMEPMWTMVYVPLVRIFLVQCNMMYRNDKPAKDQELLHQLYHDTFDGTPDYLRMAMLAPQTFDGKRYRW